LTEPGVADAVAIRPRELVAAGRTPGAVVVGQVARRASRSGALWGLVFGFYVAASALGYASLYKTQAARDDLAHTFGSSIGITALVGPARSINTVAGFTAWRCLGVLSLVGAVWGLLTATRLMRGEEEAGRWELLLGGQTTRRRAAAQALVGLAAGLGALFAVTAVLTVATGRSSKVGVSVGASIYFALTLVAGAAMFLAIGAVTSQLVNTRRRAATIAGAIFGIAFALRMVADSDPSLHWIVWLSSLGWIEETRPLTDPHPIALVPVVTLVIVAAAAALRLAGARDAGAAVLADRDSSPPHLLLLGSPTALVVRLVRPVAIAWLVAIAAFSVLIGLVAEAGAQATTGSGAIEAAIARLAGHSAAVNAYLGLTFLMVAMTIALVAAGQVTATRAEEADGRLENLVVRPVSRTTWLSGRLLVAVVLLVVSGALAGICAWIGAASQHSGVQFGSLVAAGLNVVPPALFLLGLGTLVHGVWPRLTSVVVYGYVAWSFLIELIGAIIHASHWLLDTSVFFHMVPAPAANPNWSSGAVIAAIGVVAALVGVVFFNRRDVTGA
jgi:ABC-2 type transport system permease protein